MIIKRLSKEYISDIVKLELSTLNTTLGEDMLENAIDDPFSIYLVATINDKLVGYISSHYVSPELEILNFCVNPSNQRQGVGQALYNELLKISNAKKVFLDVKSTNNKGKSFYKKNGFKEISIRKSYYSDNTDDIVMMKEII